MASASARRSARPAPVSGPPRPLCTSPPPQHGLSLAYTLLCGLHTTQLPGRDVIPPGITILLEPCPPERPRAFLLPGSGGAPK